jgi:hypothetical protein
VLLPVIGVLKFIYQTALIFSRHIFLTAGFSNTISVFSSRSSNPKPFADAGYLDIASVIPEMQFEKIDKLLILVFIFLGWHPVIFIQNVFSQSNQDILE